MAFLKSKQRPTYLHFLDRELRRAEGATYTDENILEFLITAVLNSNTFSYSSASLLQESNRLFPQATTALIELEKLGFIRLLTNEHSFNEFIISRRSIYAHNETRYPMYFSEANEILWPKSPHYLESSTTSILRNALLNWIDSSDTSIGVAKDTLGKEILDAFREKLYKERDKAVTLDLLLTPEQLNVDYIRRNSGRIVSYFYTSRYLEVFGGDILSNIPRLSFFNSLCTAPKINDYQLLRSILNCCRIPRYFFVNGKLKLERLVFFLNSPYFKHFQVELFAATHALVECIENEQHANISQAIQLFTTNFKSQISDLNIEPHEFLYKCQLALSSTSVLLSHIQPNYYKFHEMAKDELSTTKRILVVTTTLLEAKAFTKSMTSMGYIPTPIPVDKLTVFNFGVIGNSEILMLKLGEMGSDKVSGSMLVVKEAIITVKPDYVIMLGIAFGFKNAKRTIGTILVSRELEDYESAKISAKGIIQRGQRIPAGPTLLNRFDSATITYDKFPVEVGLVISGDKLVDNEEFVKTLKNSFPEAIGGEMEGTGLQSSCHRDRVEWILIKGICDWGFNKQHEHKDRDQQTAIDNVCDYFIYTMTTYPL